jgi:hypothetical protein
MEARIRLITLVLTAISFGVIGGCTTYTQEMDKETPLAGTSPMSVPASPMPTTSKAQPISTNDEVPLTPQPNNDCIEQINLTPGETSRDAVSSLWGEPDAISKFGGEDASWFYNALDTSEDIMVTFSKGTVAEIWLPLSNCTLGDVVALLGPPEIVEVILQNDEPGPPVYPTTNFHYPSQGVTFIAPCPAGTLKACTTCRPTDELETKRLYSPTTVEAIVSQAYPPMSTFVEWPGFDK